MKLKTNNIYRIVDWFYTDTSKIIVNDIVFIIAITKYGIKNRDYRFTMYNVTQNITCVFHMHESLVESFFKKV